MMDSLWVALATYSRIPVPRGEWTRESLRYSLCFFPLVGVAVGALELGWLYLAARLGFGALLTGAVGCLVPLAVTGGIHMDGFMDTLDALSSRRSREEMLRILKDSHAGAFAVMGCALYLILSAAALSEMSFKASVVLSAGFVLSRALSAFCVAFLPAARADGMAASVKNAAERRGASAVMTWSIGWITVFAAAMLLYAPLLSLVALGWAAVVVAWYLGVTRRFGGVTGDLAGWFLQVCELGFMLTLSIGGRYL